MSHTTLKPKSAWWGALFVPFAPLLMVMVLLWTVYFLVSTVFFYTAVWCWWCLRGRDILFVYSESPIWQEYIEKQLLPRLGDRAVVLNWSERKKWRFSLARMVFSRFGRTRAFNPLAVVFRPFRRTHTFRFLQPFKDFKHGHPEALHRMEKEFFELIGVQKHDPSAPQVTAEAKSED